MKILFIDDHSNLQEKWIEPLRAQGWGVVRARSSEDAEKIFEFHGESLAALVVSEAHVAWAEKWNYPYVVFLKSWKETQVLKHQNSSVHPAIAYLNYDSNLALVKQVITESKNKSQTNELQATGTESTSTSIRILKPETKQPVENPRDDDGTVVISLEKYEGEKLEIEKSSSTSDSTRVIDPAALKAELSLAQEKKQDKDATMMLEQTSLSNLGIELSSGVEAFLNEEAPEIEEVFSMESDDVEEMPSIQTMDEISSIESPAVEIPSLDFAPGNKDLNTMKNYLALREQDVALLTGQMRSTQERVQQLEMQLKMEKTRSGELQHLVQKQEQQIKNFDRDKQVEFEVLYGQVEDLNLQLQERTDKVRTIEAKLKITTDEVEKVKERVRVDIRRIRVREKELENQLEILKKDSTALLVARDEKILELKRKIDLLEFNMELVQEQYGKERNTAEQLRHKLKEAASAMKRAGGLLDSQN